MRIAFVVMTSLALAACGKLLAIDEDANPAVSTDAGASDSAVDGGAADDAQTTADGGFLPDGGCTARFCCNFDSPAGACAWTGVDNPVDAGFALFGPSSDQSKSPPRSLRVLTDDTKN